MQSDIVQIVVRLLPRVVFIGLGVFFLRRGKDFQKKCLEHSEAQVAIQRDIAQHLERIAAALEQRKP